MKSIPLGAGSGGRQSQELLQRIVGVFASSGLPSAPLEDATILPEGVAVTIDGFTVSPRIFPGGTLGHLAVCGATNDLAVRGVMPRHLCLSVIVEEGFNEEELLLHVRETAAACASLGVAIAAGDTKVVPKGAADGLFLTACALGTPERGDALGMHALRPGDALLLTGAPGRHGATIAACRTGLSVPALSSDCALLRPALASLSSLPGLHAMRDCTRGGVATALCEWAENAALGIVLDEESIPRDEGVHSVADLLGFDVLQLACEGTAIVAVTPEECEKALALLRQHPTTAHSVQIGVIGDRDPGMVAMRTALGGTRLVDMPLGEILPRIC